VAPIISPTTETFSALTASDLMTRDLVRLPRQMPLRDAARLLLHNRITGAPVVDARGRCVGVLSLTDVGHAIEKGQATAPNVPPVPLTCKFVVRNVGPDGKEIFTCTLPFSVCPAQVKQNEPNGEELIICSQPHCVWTNGQLVQVENLPTDEVGRFMTPDPVMALPETSIRTLARRMLDASIHRVIVVDQDNHPIGIVSSMDIMAAVAYSDAEL
jgi:predicted transcriptional regulator